MGTRPPNSDTTLTGKSPYLSALAILIAAASLGIAIFVGLSKSDLSTLLEPTIILGATSGFMVSASALSRIEVRADKVRLVNAFREITIRSRAIAGLQTDSGIYIILRNGKRLVPTTYTPALGKRFSGNRREIGRAHV